MSKDLAHALSLFAESQGVDKVEIIIDDDGFVKVKPVKKAIVERITYRELMSMPPKLRVETWERLHAGEMMLDR